MSAKRYVCANTRCPRHGSFTTKDGYQGIGAVRMGTRAVRLKMCCGSRGRRVRS